jgi:DNA polymerase III delta subunit
MSAALLLAHGDDAFEIDRALRDFARAIDAADRVEIVPERSPDEAALERAVLEAGSMSMFGPHLTVLRQPIRAAGRSAAAAEKLLALVAGLPDGAALALADLRASRDGNRPPALLARLIEAVQARGGRVDARLTPRRGQLQAWIRGHAVELGVEIEPRAAALLAERVGGAIAETDVERGEQTRIAHAELEKLATYAEGRPIAAGDVEELVADARPASLYAITNAIDRRDPRLAAAALQRALDEGQPVLRIMAAIAGRIGDLIVTRDLLARSAPAAEIARRVGRGNMRMAERLAEATRGYSGEELEEMLIGLFEADLAIKANLSEGEPAVSAWMGTYLLGVERRPAERSG